MKSGRCYLCAALLAVFCCASDSAFGQLVGDGFSIYTTDWDREPVGGPYHVLKWTYDADTDAWSRTEQALTAPLLQNDAGYTGRLSDMGADLIPLGGTLTGIFTASQGVDHFPSGGTEFQQRTLNMSGEWATASATPLFSTPANVSPLGVDVYKVGNNYRLTWVEDSDTTSIGTIYDQALSLAGGVFSLSGSPVTVHSHTLQWGAQYGSGNGGLSSVTVSDWDADGDADVIFTKPHYGDSPVTLGFYLAEQTAPGVYAAATELYHFQDPGGGLSDTVRSANIDGDGNPDFLTTQAGWNQVLWLEKEGGVLVDRGMIVDLQAVASSLGSDLDHVFGLYANEPLPIGAIPGDVDFDGDVDIFDVNFVSAHWGESGPDGDANGDGTVDIFDVNLISANWTGGGGGAAAVPEPSSWLLLALSVVFGARRLARGRRIGPQN